MSIVLNDVCCSLGGTQVLQGLSLSLEQGSRTVLMGRSGLGKTTLLRLLAGLLPPDSGSIAGVPQPVSILFQEDRLLPWYTVRQNLAIAVPQVPDSRIAPLLQSLGLAGWEDAFPTALSGGMARRAALARALLRPCGLLLLDEPFAGLDEETKKHAAAAILQAAGTCTVVAVAHDIQEAALLQAAVVRLQEH